MEITKIDGEKFRIECDQNGVELINMCAAMAASWMREYIKDESSMAYIDAVGLIYSLQEHIRPEHRIKQQQ